MDQAFKSAGSFLRRFRRSQDGGPTVEFVLVFFPFVILLVSSFELGLMTARHVMLERGLDMAIRQVRLNSGTALTETQVKSMVCRGAGIIPDCMINLRLEMQPINMFYSGAVADNSMPNDASCTDINVPYAPARTFTNGASNQVMMVRACGLFQPMLPSIGLGYFLAQGEQDRYRLVSMSAFVMEPAT